MVPKLLVQPRLLPTRRRSSFNKPSSTWTRGAGPMWLLGRHVPAQGGYCSTPWSKHPGQLYKGTLWQPHCEGTCRLRNRLQRPYASWSRMPIESFIWTVWFAARTSDTGGKLSGKGCCGPGALCIWRVASEHKPPEMLDKSATQWHKAERQHE